MVDNQQINTDAYQEQANAWTVGGDNILFNQDGFESTSGFCHPVKWLLKKWADRNTSLDKVLCRNVIKNRVQESWEHLKTLFICNYFCVLHVVFFSKFMNPYIPCIYYTYSCINIQIG